MDRRGRRSRRESQGAEPFVSTRQALGFVGLVGLSAVTMAGAGGATPVEIGLLGAFGLVLGGTILFAIGVTPWRD